MFLAVFACLCLSLGVFINLKHLFANFAVLICPSWCVFVNFKRLFAVFACLCVSLCVFTRLCVSLLVFVCLCIVCVSLRYLDRPFPGQVCVFAGQVKIVSHSSCRTSVILKYFCFLIYFTFLSLCKLETPLRVLWQTVKTQLKLLQHTRVIQ